MRNYGYGYSRWFGNGYVAPSTLMPNPSTFVPLPSVWNEVVARERAKRAARPKPTLSPGTRAELDALTQEVKDSYEYLRSLPPEEKAEARKAWMQARDDLERARIRAARELRR